MTHCPRHPTVRIVTFCPACRGAKGGKVKSEKQTEHRRELRKYPRRPCPERIYRLFVERYFIHLTCKSNALLFFHKFLQNAPINILVKKCYVFIVVGKHTRRFTKRAHARDGGH